MNKLPHGDVSMWITKRLRLTKAGRAQIQDYSHIPGAIMRQIGNDRKLVFEVVRDIKQTHYEYKYVEPAIFAEHIANLIKQGQIIHE